MNLVPRCQEITYLYISDREGGGADVIVECDGAEGDCGWSVLFTPPFGIDDDEWQALRQRHHRHAVSRCERTTHGAHDAPCG